VRNIKGPDILLKVKPRRFRWLEHVYRKDESDPCRSLNHMALKEREASLKMARGD
jgi:hypothetical protein